MLSLKKDGEGRFQSLEEKLIVVNKNQKFNQVVILAGGAGCLAKGTKILMHDKTRKNVENVKVGDLIMGVTDSKRTVEELTSGIEQMLKVTINENISYICNRSHIHSFCTIEKEIYNISYDEYLNLSKIEKEALFLYDHTKNYKFKIEELDEGEYFGFSIKEDDKRFCLANGIITHNSGKGFATKNFTNLGDSYKTLDVDELKQGLLKLNALKNTYPDIKNLNLRTPKDVAKLHMKIVELGWQESKLNSLMKSIISANPNRKPNLLFDQTAKTISSIQKRIDYVIELGYKPEDIHIIWAFADFRIAMIRNKNRDRIVPEDILMQTHEGATKTMMQIIKDSKLLKNFNGEFYIINTTTKKEAQVTVKVNEAMDTFKGTVDTKKKRVKHGEASFPVENFLYIKIKERGKPIKFSKSTENTLINWIIKNAPRTAATGDIFKDIKDKYPTKRM